MRNCFPVKARWKALCLAGTLACLLPATAGAQTAPLTLTLDAGATLTTFIPFNVFGANVAYWVPKADNLAVQPLVEAAGNYFFRYPGGGQSDNYHWNGTGSFDASGHWVPDNTNYSGGFEDVMKYRGTTSPFTNWVDHDWASHLTDGDPSTAWLSDAYTTFPNHQWAELDLTGNFSPGGVTQVNGVTILWGTPSAASFQVQYWTGPTYPPPYMAPSESPWADTSAGTLSGTGDGTTQGVTFNTVSTEYLRILLTSSTAGAGGTYSIRELYVDGPTGQVSRNNATQSNGQPDQTWAAASSTDTASLFHRTPDFNFEDFMAYCNSFTPHAMPLITTNLGTGTPQEAAAWVHYANGVKGYGIKYWQAGNEVNGRWETGGPVNAADHVRRFIRYYDAMKAVDPSIRVVGPVMALNGDSPTESSLLHDGRPFIEDYIRLTAAAGVSLHGDASYYFDGIDFHWYPFWGSFTAAQALAAPPRLDSMAVSLRAMLSSAGVTGVDGIPVIMSEYNSTSDEQNFNVQLGNGLFVADTLGHFITAFGPAGHANYWAVLNGGTCETNPTGGDPGYLNRAHDAYQYQRRAGYWAMQMMTHDWAIPADKRPHSLVQTSANGEPSAELDTYSDYRPDGVLSLLVVNKDPATAFDAVVSVGPFVPNNTAPGWAFDSSNYRWVTTGSTPYHADPDTAPSTFTAVGSGGAFPVTFKPFSITVLQFTNSGVPTNTPTATPTITLTPTPTPPPHYGPTTLVDDFEDPARDGVSPTRTNLWNGTWSTLAAAGSGITVQYGAPGAAGTSRAAGMAGTVGASPTPGWSNYTTSLADLSPSTPFNLAAGGIVGLQFWFYGDGATYRVTLPSQAVTDYDWYGAQITPPKDRWTFYQIPFSAMTRQGWGAQTGLPAAFAGTDVTGIQFSTQGTGAFSYRVDQVGFYTAAGESPTPTPVASQSPTATPFPQGAGPVIYPNPWRGQDPAQVQLWLKEAGPVRMRIFTSAFRKVADRTYPDLPAGPQKLGLDLRDSGGDSLADGLYYVLVKTPTRRDTSKFLILR